MGCFLACFGSAKERRRKPGKRTPPRDRSRGNYASLQPSCSPLKLPTKETAVSSLLETRDEQDDLSFNSRKKVTFDLNVKTYDAEFPVQEVEIYSSESKEEEELKEKEDKKSGDLNNSALSQDNSTNSSSGSFPSNHRYGNCISSDDEAEYEDSDFDDDGDDEDDGSDYEVLGDEEDEEGEETFHSYSSIPMEMERGIFAGHLAFNDVTDVKPICGSPDRKPALLANGNARDRSQYIHSVLNPVENLSQWKAVKAKPTPLKHSKKENVDLEEDLQIPFSAEPTFKVPRSQKSVNFSSNFDVTKPSAKQEISVDASLSNWLVSSETTPPVKISIAPTESSGNSKSQRSYPSINREDRPILGALTVEELRQSVSSSPRKSPSRSPDEIPIVGTVGSYWNHSDMGVDSSSSQRSGSGVKGIPNTTSKYREDKKVNWHSTPFEVRLERALTNDGAEAYSSNPTRVC
eukprot:TRINITY_DN10641_c0_g2_i2.p1 TRINITY_DN10641_c0_g2~~TRINITY_DN10641_c0_g2_i2.p1  ORF type:complete len:462 (-),score=99.18 TRINITY_DN10641_c0_g2_i2:434-1819(-)